MFQESSTVHLNDEMIKYRITSITGDQAERTIRFAFSTPEVWHTFEAAIRKAAVEVESITQARLEGEIVANHMSGSFNYEFSQKRDEVDKDQLIEIAAKFPS